MAALTRKLYFAYINKSNVIFPILKYLLAIILVSIIAYKIDFFALGNTFIRANMFIIGFVLLLGAVNILLQFVKWKLICNQVLEEKEQGKIVNSLFYGFSAGITTPFRVGEYVGRAIPFKRNILHVSLASAIDKFIPLLVILVFGLISSFTFLYSSNSGLKYLVFVPLAIIVSAAGLFYFKKELTESGLFSKITNLKIIKDNVEIVNYLRALDTKFLLRIFFISIVFVFTYTAQFALLVAAFTYKMELMNYLWASSLVIFTKALFPPVTFGELGIRETAAIFFFGLVGASEAAAFQSSIVLFFINLVIPALIGSFMLIRRK